VSVKSVKVLGHNLGEELDVLEPHAADMHEAGIIGWEDTRGETEVYRVEAGHSLAHVNAWLATRGGGEKLFPSAKEMITQTLRAREELRQKAEEERLKEAQAKAKEILKDLSYRIQEAARQGDYSLVLVSGLEKGPDYEIDDEGNLALVVDNDSNEYIFEALRILDRRGVFADDYRAELRKIESHLAALHLTWEPHGHKKDQKKRKKRG
jgi:hypothetical protein